MSQSIINKVGTHIHFMLDQGCIIFSDDDVTDDVITQKKSKTENGQNSCNIPFLLSFKMKQIAQNLGIIKGYAVNLFNYRYNSQ